MAFCGLACIYGIWQLSHLSVSIPHFLDQPVFYVSVVVWLLYLAGAVAGFFMYCGARWARIFIGVLAVLFAIICIAQMIRSESIIFSSIIAIFALVTLVLLLLPRHEPVA